MSATDGIVNETRPGGGRMCGNLEQNMNSFTCTERAWSKRNVHQRPQLFWILVEVVRSGYARCFLRSLEQTSSPAKPISMSGAPPTSLFRLTQILLCVSNLSLPQPEIKLNDAYQCPNLHTCEAPSSDRSHPHSKSTPYLSPSRVRTIPLISLEPQRPTHHGRRHDLL